MALTALTETVTALQVVLAVLSAWFESLELGNLDWHKQGRALVGYVKKEVNLEPALPRSASAAAASAAAWRVRSAAHAAASAAAASAAASRSRSWRWNSPVARRASASASVRRLCTRKSEAQVCCFCVVSTRKVSGLPPQLFLSSWRGKSFAARRSSASTSARRAYKQILSLACRAAIPATASRRTCTQISLLSKPCCRVRLHGPELFPIACSNGVSQ